jgi:hypothetical protein
VRRAGALPGQSGGSAPAIRKDVRVSEAVVETPERRGVLSRINWRDVILVLAISLFTSLISQRWTGTLLDGQFYASLSLFGSDATDRAIFESYYWTRLGVIAPMHAFTSIFGTWLGFAGYRFLLILIIVTASYLILKRYTHWRTAATLTAFISLNTVILSYFGNTYLTGIVMSGTVALIATAVMDGTSQRGNGKMPKRPPIVAGVIIGWLAMSNPAGMILAAVIWFVIRLFRRTHVVHYLWTAASAIVTFGVFLLIGKAIFPKMNWIESYINSDARTRLSDFASKSPIWPDDISMLVPAMILVICIGVWFANRTSWPARLGFMISATSIAFMFVFNPLMGGIALEAPMYQAMLFPPAMLALALSISAVTSRHEEPTETDRWSIRTYAAAVIGIVMIIAAGFSNPGWSIQRGWIVAAVTAAAAIILLVNRRSSAQLATVFIAAALVISSGQLLQNSRPGALGLYFQSPYSYAFQPNDTNAKMHAAVNTQEWLLANTEPTDQILAWVDGDWIGGDRELYMVAGMQLWGENRLGIVQTLGPDDFSRLNTLKPSVIAMYGPSREQIQTFWQALPGELKPSDPNCYDFTWPNPSIPLGHACLTRLNWNSN